MPREAVKVLMRSEKAHLQVRDVERCGDSQRPTISLVGGNGAKSHT